MDTERAIHSFDGKAQLLTGYARTRGVEKRQIVLGRSCGLLRRASPQLKATAPPIDRAARAMPGARWRA
jgi:hypothetical protein